MRYVKFLMIPAAFMVGVFAVNAVQAQSAYVQPTYYAKTGYNPVVAGSYVNYLADGQTYMTQAGDGSYYVKSDMIDPLVGAVNYAPTVQYLQPSAVMPMPYQAGVRMMPSGRTFVRPDGTFVNADGQQVYYVMGEPRVVVVRDTSDLPGYGVVSRAPTSMGAKPYDAQDFPAVFSKPGTASYYLDIAFPNGN